MLPKVIFSTQLSTRKMSRGIKTARLCVKRSMCQISWSILSLVKSLTAVVIALALVGCGFQLRGQDLINSGYSYVVSGEAKDSRLARELSARLSQPGVLAQDAAEITVELIDVRRQQVDGAVTAEAMLLE